MPNRHLTLVFETSLQYFNCNHISFLANTSITAIIRYLGLAILEDFENKLNVNKKGSLAAANIPSR